MRGTVTIGTDANHDGVFTTVITSKDSLYEPLWTRLDNAITQFGYTGADAISCRNSSDDYCRTWGQTATGTPNSVRYKLLPSVFNVPADPDVSVADDIKNVIIPAWSRAAADSPFLSWCTSCTTPPSNIIEVSMVPHNDPDLNFNLAVTSIGPAQPQLINHGFIKFVNPETLPNSPDPYDHSCGTTDNGCIGGAPNTFDDRTLLSHEFGHSLGLGHCNLDFSVMCGVRDTVTTNDTYGTVYWTPRKRDLLALEAMYP